jgi:hypothetical protein
LTAWVIDELTRAKACRADLLISALERWRNDRTVFLPKAEIEHRLRMLAQ